MTRNYPHAVANGHAAAKAVIAPVANATVPYWRSELHPLDEHRSIEELPEECDIAIIGAGMSGVSIAYHLLKLYGDKPNSSITLLEARQLCSGATGRNGGHVKFKINSFQSIIESFGEKAAEELSDFNLDMIFGIKNVVEKENLDCEFELRRTYDVFLDQEDADKAEQLFRKGVKEGRRWTKERDFVPEGRAEQVTSIKCVKAAVSGPCCSLWPYKFVTQLMERIIDKVNLQTNTPVEQVSLDSGSKKHLVSTPRGILRAKKVIYATNGYTGGICPSYKDKIIPIRGTASHISPPNPVSPHLSHTYNIVYRSPNVDYLNPRPDGGIVVGGAGNRFRESRDLWYNNWDDSTLIPNTKSHFEGLMQRNFKGWDDSGARLESYWTGIMGNTTDGWPHIGKVPGKESEYIHAGFNGGGMSMIWLCSLGLARMVKQGVEFGEVGLPGMFEATAERLKNTI